MYATKVAVNIEEQVQLAKEKRLLFYSDQLRQDQKKRTVSAYLVYKRIKRIVKSSKDWATISLASLGIKLLAIIDVTSYTFWEELLLRKKYAIDLTTLESKEQTFRVNYER